MVEKLFDKRLSQGRLTGVVNTKNFIRSLIKGISHRVSYPHAHQQNGAAERKHHHMVQVGLPLLAHASMPLKFWYEAFLTSTYLINSIPNKVINYDTPLERLLHQKPDYSSVRVFGCACWPNLRPYNKHKLQFRSQQCVFLGYSSLHRGFKCLDVASDHVYISLDVIFDESEFLFAKLHSNAGARLRSEILLLPSHLLNPTTSIGVAQIDDHVSDGPGFTNDIGENFDENSRFSKSNNNAGAQDGHGTNTKADPALTPTAAAP
jgi:hypothetical protein